MKQDIDKIIEWYYKNNIRKFQNSPTRTTILYNYWDNINKFCENSAEIKKE